MKNGPFRRDFRQKMTLVGIFAATNPPFRVARLVYPIYGSTPGSNSTTCCPVCLFNLYRSQCPPDSHQTFKTNCNYVPLDRFCFWSILNSRWPPQLPFCTFLFFSDNSRQKLPMFSYEFLHVHRSEDALQAACNHFLQRLFLLELYNI